MFQQIYKNPEHTKLQFKYVQGMLILLNIDIYNLKKINGGKNTICSCPSKFKLIKFNKESWEKGGCHKTSKDCWHLGYKNGFFCNA